MHPNHPFVPLLPPELLSRHYCHEPQDTRFRAAARLLQALWRETQGHPCGRILDTAGKLRRLGSRLTDPVARTGANLVDPTLAPLVRREIAYREIGALIETERLWSNLLASQPLTFSLFGPLKRNPALATPVLARLFPDLVGTVTDILFEHSPGRADPAYTGDNTAFDVLIRCTTPAGRRAFVAIEIKYSEAPGGITAPQTEIYTALSRTAGIYRDPDGPALRTGGLEQFWRQQLLATAMLERGLYDEGRVVVVAPAANRECQIALTRYAAQLTTAEPAAARFEVLTLEALVAALAATGLERHAGLLVERYLDFAPVEAALTATFGTA